MFSDSLVLSSPEVTPAGKKLDRLRGTIRTGVAAAAVVSAAWLGGAQTAEAGPVRTAGPVINYSDGSSSQDFICQATGKRILASKSPSLGQWTVEGVWGDDARDAAEKYCPAARPARAPVARQQPPRRTLQECRGEGHVSDEIRCLLTGNHFEQADKKIKEAPAVHVGVALTFAMEAGCKEYATSIATGFEMSVEKEKESREDFDLPAVRIFSKKSAKTARCGFFFNYHFKQSVKF